MLKGIFKHIAFFLILSNGLIYAQDPEFTQFYANPLYLNPAFAGNEKCPVVHLNYRNQWPSIPNNFITYSASYDQYAEKLYGGIGLLVLKDKAGDGALSTTNISGLYSYQMNVTRKFAVKAGFQATYAQKSIDWSKLTFGDMIDDRQGFIYSTNETQGSNKKTYFDASAGLLAFSKQIYFGFAAHHLTQPNEGLITSSKLPMKLTGHAGMMIPIGTKESETYISPNILYQNQKGFQQFNVGLYVVKGIMVAGLWYRGGKDSFIGLIGLEYNKMKIGYSYDIAISKLSGKVGGSHELSFGIQFDCKPKKKKYNTMNCPRF